MRTFIAIDISPTQEIQLLLNDFLKNLNGVEIKYSDVANYHITLAFLGETSSFQLNEICKYLDSIKLTSNKIDIKMRGLGVFKHGQSPTAIWVGIEPNDYLNELWIAVNKVFTELDFESNLQKFTPHLTLSRIKKIEPTNNLQLFKNKYQEVSFGETSITEFVYYQSTLSAQGSIYKVIRKFKI